MKAASASSQTPVVFLGDSHAVQPVIRLCRDIKVGSTVIHVGDFGAWDTPRFWNDVDDLNRVLEKRNLNLYVIRGNHDLKSIWYEGRNVGRVQFLEDYTEKIINGDRYLFVGGGYSVDRSLRLERGYVYDPNEPMIYKPTTPCSVLVSHTGPRRYLSHLLTFPIERYFAIDANLKEDLQREQDMVDDILRDCKPKVHVWGHFHVSNKCRDNGTVFQCLDIEEVKSLEDIRS